MIGLRFTKQRRLLNAQDYKSVFDQAEYRASHKHLLILARQNTLGHPRLGIIVAKKNTRRAVDRNRLKRIIREQFRTSLSANIDMVVLSRSGLDKLEACEINQIVMSQFKKIEQRQK